MKKLFLHLLLFSLAFSTNAQTIKLKQIEPAGGGAGYVPLTGTAGVLSYTPSSSIGFKFGTGYNVRDYGLVGNGVTDDRSALNTLLNTTAPDGSTIYFPPGTYYIGSSIIINSGKKFRIISDQAKITSGNYIVFNISSSYDWFIQGLEFICTTYGGQASAISIGAGSGGGGGFRISDCKFNSYAIAIQLSGTQGNLELRGGVIMNNRFISNDYAIYCENYGEYIDVIGNTIMGCPNAGLWLKGGNFLVANNLIVQNGRGIQVVNGNNNGHGVISGNEINHSTNYSIDLQDASTGMSLTGNNIFDGPILINNTSYVSIVGGQIQTQSITTSNNTGLVFSGVQFVKGYGNTYTNTAGTAPAFVSCFGDMPAGSSSVASTFSNTNLTIPGGYVGKRLSVGTSTPIGSSQIYIGSNTTGSANYQNIFLETSVQSDVNGSNYGFLSSIGTQATTFTLPTLAHFTAGKGTFGAGSTVTNHYGFLASNITGATNNYGFYSQANSASNTWGFYMAGTANNYIAGKVGIGSGKTVPQATLDVAGTLSVSSQSDFTKVRIKSGTNFSTGTLTLSAGTATAANNSVTSKSMIFVTSSSTVNAGVPSYSVNPSTSFTISTSNPSDSRVIKYWIVDQN